MVVDDSEDIRELIRRMGVARVVVIPAFSAPGSGAGRAGALAAGCDEFVRKHLGMKELSALLERHLGGGRAR